MRPGLIIRNQANTVQIDERYANLALVEKGTINVNSTSGAEGGAGGSRRYYPMTKTGLVNPMLALRCTTDPVAVRRTTNSGSSWTWGIYTDGVADVDYYIFDEPGLPVERWGLNVRRPSDNKLLFHSGHPPMIWAGQLAGTWPSSGSPPALTGLPAGTYAAITSISGYVERDVGPVETYNMVGARANADGLSAGLIRMSGITGHVNHFATPHFFVAVDVTGF